MSKTHRKKNYKKNKSIKRCKKGGEKDIGEKDINNYNNDINKEELQPVEPVEPVEPFENTVNKQVNNGPDGEPIKKKPWWRFWGGKKRKRSRRRTIKK